MQFTKEVKVQVPDGLHHQTAATFIQTANRFSSLIRVTYGTNNVNAKSLLGVLSLSIGMGALVTLTAEGDDGRSAVQPAYTPCRAPSAPTVNVSALCGGGTVPSGPGGQSEKNSSAPLSAIIRRMPGSALL